jgi:hypothetical protein
MYYPGICLEELRETKRHVSQGSPSPRARLEPGTTRLRTSANRYVATKYKINDCQCNKKSTEEEVEPTPETRYMRNAPQTVDTVEHNIHAIPEEVSLLLLHFVFFHIVTCRGDL